MPYHFKSYLFFFLITLSPAYAMNLESQLIDSAQTGNWTEVDRLLQAGAAVDKRGGSVCTALHIASTYGHAPIVERLLQAGASVDKVDTQGETALHKALTYGHAPIIERLLQAGASVDKVDKHDRAAVHKATSAPAVRRLIQAGASVDKADTQGCTALHYASIWAHSKVMVGLIGEGAALDKPNNKGQTALHIASRSGNAPVMNLLLQGGANPIPLFEYFPRWRHAYANGREKYLSVKRENQWQKKRLLWIAYNKENPDETPLASLPTDILKHIWKFGLHTFSKQEWDEWQQFKEKNPKIKRSVRLTTFQSLLKNRIKKIFENEYTFLP